MNKIEDQTRLGEFEQLALLAVMRLGEDACGATIQEELERRAGRAASISQIYITLMRLESRGLVQSRLGSPEPVRGGKARRYFALEPAGVAVLSEARTRLFSMWEGLEGRLEAAGGRSGAE
jgi:PadR family transcriptional regulator PadR